MEAKIEGAGNTEMPGSYSAEHVRAMDTAVGDALLFLPPREHQYGYGAEGRKVYLSTYLHTMGNLCKFWVPKYNTSAYARQADILEEKDREIHELRVTMGEMYAEIKELGG